MVGNRTCFVLAAVIPGATAIGQVELYGVSRADRTLHRMSAGAPQATLVGTLTPLASGADLAGLVFTDRGVAYTVDRDANSLVTVRLSDAHVVASVALDQDVWVTRRGFDISPDGVLYGVLPGMNLRTIDPETGRTTFVAAITGATTIEAIAFADDGTLYAAGNSGSNLSRKLYVLDTVTGVATFRYDVPVNDIDVLTVGSDGFLYAADSGPFSAALFRIDPVTGAFSNVGDTGVIELDGLAAVRVFCPADTNDDGEVNSTDFFVFLSLFFAGNADFNRDGQTSSQDLFDFLAAFFAGCD